MSQSQYQYQPLYSPDDIRLVYLHPPISTPSSDESSESLTAERRNISINIRVAKLGTCNFSALSYVWGNDDCSEVLEVHEYASTKTLQITPSLRIALEHLQETGSKAIWIDQISINQKDYDERSKEVWKMSDIYAGAADVIIWLGEANQDSDRAMKFIPQISVSNIDRLATSEDEKDSWSALANLLRRPWFTRRWIIQEVAFARRARLRCGSLEVSWPQFAEAVTLFETRIDWINPMFRERKWESADEKTLKYRKMGSYALMGGLIVGGVAVAAVTRSKPSWMPTAINGLKNWANGFQREMESPFAWKNYEYPIGQVRGVGAHSLVVALDQIVRKRPGNQELERLCTTEGLLSYLPTFNCKEPQDVVFAVASLAKDKMQMNLHYQDPAVSTYVKVIRHTVLQTNSLNIICRPWVPVLPNAPSWLTPLSRLSFERQSDGIHVRVCPDSLTSHPGHCPYKASRSRHASVDFQYQNLRHILAAKGFRLGSSYTLLDSAINGIIPTSWVESDSGSFRLGDYASEEEIELYWRTLVCDRDNQGGPAPIWMRRACEELYKDSYYTPMDTEKILRTRSDESDSLSGLMKAFLSRVQAAIWNRRMIRLGNHSLGLLPNSAKIGDEICILFGCDVPVLLRQHDGGLWEFIGEAYIHGIMDGEALDGDFKEETFSLL